MLKRLIEVALPLKEVSEQSAREKSIRHGHISTLHIWWARRPLAACRAVVFASLIPDPDDPECPPVFGQLVRQELGGRQFKPTDSDGAAIEDTPRNRCLEFIKHLVRWENSNVPEFIEPARRLIKAAHKILHPDSDSEVPKVLDPFAGGGAIPLEALRLGCEAHAIDINPVAHLIELCTLVYPQKYGQPLPPDSPVPEYITEDGVEKGWFPSDRKKGKSAGLFGDDAVTAAESEYRRNPLAADVKYWGHWVLEKARKELAEFYPPDPDGSVPIAYLWARTVKCPNPACGATIPLVRQLWLCKKNRSVALRMTPNRKTKRCDFTVVEGTEVDFDPESGSVQEGKAACPFCGSVAAGEYLRAESKAGRMGGQILSVVVACGSRGKAYRKATPSDTAVYESATKRLARAAAKDKAGLPNEPMTPDRPSPNSRGLSGVVRYGLSEFGHLYNARQSLALLALCRSLHAAVEGPCQQDEERASAVADYLALVFDWFAEKSTILTRWHNTRETISGTFSKQALPMVWDYAEVMPFTEVGAGFLSGLEWCLRVVGHLSVTGSPSSVARASADRLPYEPGQLDAIVTDPPYYDAVPYSDLSDFFYTWLKRTVGGRHADLFRTPLTPKTQELIAYYGPGKRKVNKPPEWYEAGMARAFGEMQRTVIGDGVAAVMFAHKTTSAWEAAIGGMLKAGLLITSSWPLHTEMKTRTVARDAAALASSVTLVCRKRATGAGESLWDDVRRELREVAAERLDFFWNQGIRGADFFISGIGPALSVFGRYERVVRLSGEEVSVGQFLDEVRDLVTHYALSKVIKGGQVGHIDSETQFYVVWKWSYGSGKVPADEAFTLAKALGLPTDTMWDKTGVLEKTGQNVLAAPVPKRLKVKALGEPAADGAPASIVDVLHRLCAFREKGDTGGAAEFLAHSGRARDQSLWLVAQALSEILPDGDKEKQLMQGLLNQRDALIDKASDRLF